MKKQQIICTNGSTILVKSESYSTAQLKKFFHKLWPEVPFKGLNDLLGARLKTRWRRSVTVSEHEDGYTLMYREDGLIREVTHYCDSPSRVTWVIVQNKETKRWHQAI